MTARIVSKGIWIVPVFFIIASLVLVFYSSTATSAPAPHSSYFTDRCASCHTDDDSTCNGCHKHGNVNLTVTPDKSSYTPGELMNINFDGGARTGWIRGMLVDHNNTEVDRKTGPTFTGNDGGTEVEFPLDFSAYAPGKAGAYSYTAQYYGNNNGSGHGAIDVPFTINVGSTADLTVNVTPATSPMIFGPQGGAIKFKVDLNNTTSGPVPFDGWIDVTMPSGMNYGPILGPLHLTLPAGGSLSKILSVNLPGIAPTGVYSLNIYIEDFSVGSTFDIDSFTFIKEP